MKLTNTQTQILAGAAAHPDHLALPPGRLPIPARRAVARSLLKHGVVAAVDGTATDAFARWTVDGAAVLLAITAAGLHAICQAPAAGGLTDEELEAEQDLPQRALDAGVDLTGRDTLDQAAAAGVVPAEPAAEGPHSAIEGSGAVSTTSAASKPQNAPTAALEATGRGSRGSSLHALPPRSSGLGTMRSATVLACRT